MRVVVFFVQVKERKDGEDDIYKDFAVKKGKGLCRADLDSPHIGYIFFLIESCP